MRIARVAFFAWLILSWTIPLSAQNIPPDYAGQPAIIPNMRPSMRPHTRPSVPVDEACLPWASSSLVQPTVSTTRLEVPSKARDDYKRACAELKRKNVAAAEQNVRSAIEKYESYAAAWVMLGEILQARQDPREGQKACAEAQKADPAYLPSYLCLAEAAIQNEDWEEVLKSTRAALDLNPASDPYAYYYRAVAYFRLNGLPEAQTNALEAVRIDRTSRETSSCELLRRIYEAQGNTPPPSPDCKGF